MLGLLKKCYRNILRIIRVLVLYYSGGGRFRLVWGLRFLYPASTNNIIIIKTNHMGNIRVFLYGSDHTLMIDENVVYKKGKIWFEDSGCSIHVMRDTTIEECELAAVEDDCKILIGKDCMFSSGIRISTSDSHSVIDLVNNKRINPAADVIIGNHVWIGAGCTINKGVKIGDGSIVAGHSVCTYQYPSCAIIAGIPAKVVKTESSWKRKRI